MRNDEENINPRQEIDTLVRELQTYGDLETKLRDGLTVKQVVTFMKFRAQLIELIYQCVNAQGHEAENTADIVKQFYIDLMIELLSNNDDQQIVESYKTPAELLADCKSVVETLMNSEAPEQSSTPITKQSFMRIYQEARPELPIQVILTEITLQLADLEAGSGTWQDNE